MRSTFAKTVIELMKTDPSIILLTADMGVGVFEELQSIFPERLINTGVAEANTVGIAAGFALSGFKPIFYAQAPFATMRCFEQIRLDIAVNNLPVVVVGTSAGFTLSQYGVSHHSVEDIALMRLLPNMTIVCPGDIFEAEMATRAAVASSSPIYIRIGRSDSFGSDQLIHTDKPSFSIGKSIMLSHGTDIALIATGSMLLSAKKISSLLEKDGLSVSLISMHTIKPLDGELVKKISKKVRLIATIEEHREQGGLGSAVIESFSEDLRKIKFMRYGVKDTYHHLCGTREYFLSQHCLTTEQVYKNLSEEIRRINHGAQR